MKELLRMINVSCTSSKYNLRYLNCIFFRGELIAFSCNTVSEKDTLISLLTGTIQPTEGKIIWNTEKGKYGCLINPSTNLLFEDLPIYDNFIITGRTPFLFGYSKRKGSALIADLFKRYGIEWDVSRNVSSFTQMQKYILSVLKAVYLGFPLIILSDIPSLHYGTDLKVLIHLVQALLAEDFSFIITEPENNPLLAGPARARTFSFENNFLVSIRDQYRRPVFDLPVSARLIDIRQHKHDTDRKIEFMIPWLNTRDEFRLSIHPGEIIYFIGKGLYDSELVRSLFSRNSKAKIRIDRKRVLSCPSIQQLQKYNIGYFPKTIEASVFSNLTAKDNTSMLVLDKAAHFRFLISSKYEKFFLSSGLFRDNEELNTPLYRLSFEKQLEVLVNRYSLRQWRCMIIHLPTLPKEGKAANIMKQFIRHLAEEKCSVLIIVASSSEIITDYHSMISIDQ